MQLWICVMWKFSQIIPALLICSQLPVLAEVIVPGTEILVRPETTIHVATWERGRIYPAYVSRDVFAKDGSVAIPRGAQAELIVQETALDNWRSIWNPSESMAGDTRWTPQVLNTTCRKRTIRMAAAW